VAGKITKGQSHIGIEVVNGEVNVQGVNVIVPAEAGKKDVSAQALNGDHREVVYIDPVYSMNGLRRKLLETWQTR